MSRYYVDITGVPDDFLELMGYCKVLEDDQFELRIAKDKEYILPKKGRRHLYVDDPNDAAIFRARPKVAAPPAAKITKSVKPRKMAKKAKKKR